VQDRQAPKLPRWLPPPQDVTKINVDAAISKNTGLASAAAVARDEMGTFLGASSIVMAGITDPGLYGSVGVQRGLALANDLSLRRVRTASDCSNAVRSMEGSTLGICGHIIKEIREEAAAFQEMKFVHERREANYDAHSLARSSLYNSL
jgi:hypothetical protein